jgi:hypothetical protein
MKFFWARMNEDGGVVNPKIWKIVGLTSSSTVIADH